MFHKFTLFKFTQTLIILIMGMQLLACGGGGGGGSSVGSGGSTSSTGDGSTSSTGGGSTSGTGGVSTSGTESSVLTGSFSVGWTAPVMRSDGTPLSLADINGYRIYYGTSPGSYPNVAEVSDGTATAVTVTGVPLGASYVVMTTYDEAGRESIYSREISKIVQ